MLSKMFALAVLLSLSFFGSQVNCDDHLGIDDFLNSDFHLFPNQTVHHLPNLEDQTMEQFRQILEDDQVVSHAYNKFTTRFGEKESQLGSIHVDQRKHLFKDNLMYIFKHNLLARMNKFSSFEMGVNQFSDMSVDEFRNERLGLVIPDDYLVPDDIHFLQNQDPHHNFSKSTSEGSPKTLPSQVDWREQEVISPIKDQAKCGACVMFSITSAMEGLHSIHMENGTVGLSEQHMLDCATKENGYKKNKGCDGNTFPDTLQFAIDHGLADEELFPYQGTQGTCTFAGMQPVIRLRGYQHLPNDVDKVKEVVATHGPVSFGVYVQRAFMFYNKGVYDMCVGNPIGGHAMAIVGYNENTPLKYFTIKNQWGETWGEQGYIRFTSEDARCGLTKLAYKFDV